MMAKKYLSTLFFALSALLTALFAVFLRRDYLVFYPYGSAPFYLYVIERAVECLLPAAACLIAGILLRKKSVKQ